MATALGYGLPLIAHQRAARSYALHPHRHFFFSDEPGSLVAAFTRSVVEYTAVTVPSTPLSLPPVTAHYGPGAAPLPPARLCCRL